MKQLLSICHSHPSQATGGDEKPRVSVITVVFNAIKNGRRDFLIDNLKSVHCQDYGNIEHVVVDGASKDGTVELLRKYADKGWIKLISEPDDGIYDAMNKGVMNSTGKYLAFLNSDDFWYNKSGVSRSVEALESAGADFSFAPSYTTWHEIPIQKAATCMGAVFFRMPFCHQTMFTSREAFLAEGGFDCGNFRSAADYNLIQRFCMDRYRGVFVPTNFTAYRHGGFSAEDQGTSANECKKSIRMVFSKLDPSFGEEDAEDVFLRHRMKMALFEKLLGQVGPELRTEIQALPRRQDGDSYVFDVPEYSSAVAVTEIDPCYPHVKYRRVVLKTLGVPIASYVRNLSGFELKILGICIFRGRYQT